MDQKWRKLNVLGMYKEEVSLLEQTIESLYLIIISTKYSRETGQVVNMVRGAMSQRQQPNSTTTGTTHIRIPASYQAGITLVMCADSAAAAELLHAEQLPLL